MIDLPQTLRTSDTDGASLNRVIAHTPFNARVVSSPNIVWKSGTSGVETLSH